MSKEAELGKYMSNFIERSKEDKINSRIKFLEKEVETCYRIILDWKESYDSLEEKIKVLEDADKTGIVSDEFICNEQGLYVSGLIRKEENE